MRKIFFFTSFDKIKKSVGGSCCKAILNKRSNKNAQKRKRKNTQFRR